MRRDERGYALLIDGRPLYLRGGGYSEESLSVFEGKTLQVGVRPEALRLLAAAKDGVLDFSVRLSGVERLGHEVIVHFPAINRADDLQGMHSARLVYQDGLQIGENVPLSLAAGDLYLFDEEGWAVPRME